MNNAEKETTAQPGPKGKTKKEGRWVDAILPVVSAVGTAMLGGFCAAAGAHIYGAAARALGASGRPEGNVIPFKSKTL
jgi:hypothetical protein